MPTSEADRASALANLVRQKLSDLSDSVDYKSCKAIFDDIEDVLVSQAVEKCGGNLSAAARLLGVSRPKLEYHFKKEKMS